MIMSDVSLKHCSTCNNDFPATTEFFFPSHLNTKGHNICINCHHEKSKQRITPGMMLREIAPYIPQDETQYYQILSAIAKTIGSSTAKVERDVYEKKLPVFKFIYNRTGLCLALTLEDAKTYIATHSLNEIEPEHTSTDIKETTVITRSTSDQCGACGSMRGNILGDIDETTHERYGFLCAKCFQIVRSSKRDIAIVRNVLAYMEHTRISREI